MSGFNTTPGPWKDGGHYGFGETLKDAIVSGSKVVATVFARKMELNREKQQSVCVEDSEGIANKRLVIAAPEMLDALISAYKGDIDEPSGLINTIERATGLTIDEAIKAWEADQ